MENTNQKATLEKIFYPRSIAVVGASNNPQKLGAVLMLIAITLGTMDPEWEKCSILHSLRGGNIFSLSLVASLAQTGALQWEKVTAITPLPARYYG